MFPQVAAGLKIKTSVGICQLRSFRAQRSVDVAFRLEEAFCFDNFKVFFVIEFDLAEALEKIFCLLVDSLSSDLVVEPDEAFVEVDGGADKTIDGVYRIKIKF